MLYHIAVTGLAIGIGAAVYANREEIKAFLEKKQLQWRLEYAARRRRRLHDQQQRQNGAGPQVVQQRSQGPETRDSDLFSLYEMNPAEYRDDDDDRTDRESIDTADFLSQGITNYYSTGQTSSETIPSYREPRDFSSSTASHYTRDGEFLVRRRGGGVAIPSYTNAHAPPPSYGAPSYSAASYDAPSVHSYGPGEAFSLHNMNNDPFGSDTPFETDRSLRYPSRSNSFVSDASWIMSSATEDTLSELNTPTASENEFTDDERHRIIIGQPTYHGQPAFHG